MKTQPPVTSENLLEVDISSIALDERFGALKFENSGKQLKEIQSFLREATALNFKSLLLQDQINQLEAYANRLAERLQWLQKFDLTTNGNPKGEHDNFENEVDSFYRDVYRNLAMVYLPFLREERRRNNPKERKLDDEVREVSQLRTVLQKDLEVVRADIEQIRQTKQEVGSAKGERAALRLSVYFTDEARRYATATYWWRLVVIGMYTLVLGTISILAVTYISDIQANNPGLWIGIGVTRLVFALALWYGLQFIVKNYNVNAHLAATNRHRAAVASTLEDFIAIEETQAKPRLTEMLKNSTEAMFKHVSTGFISKTEGNGGNPAYEIINTVMGGKANGS